LLYLCMSSGWQVYTTHPYQSYVAVYFCVSPYTYISDKQTLPIKKIYIDSRFKSGDSVSDSNFKIDLPQNLLMPAGTGFYIDDISIPVSWYTVDAGRNNKLYFRNTYSATIVVNIPHGDYSLVNLNNAIVAAMSSQGGNNFVAEPNVTTNKIGIKNTEGIPFEVLTDEQIKSLGYSTHDTINTMLRNYTPQINNYLWTSGYVD
jgi:hypothetical protein